MALLREADWMEKDVRDIAEKKVAAIDKKIGYPVSNPDILDAKALEKYYAPLQISDDHHFQNGLHAAQFEISLDWAKLGTPTRHDEWGMSAPTVNAYYQPRQVTPEKHKLPSSKNSWLFLVCYSFRKMGSI